MQSSYMACGPRVVAKPLPTLPKEGFAPFGKRNLRNRTNPLHPGSDNKKSRPNFGRLLHVLRNFFKELLINLMPAYTVSAFADIRSSCYSRTCAAC